MFKGPFGTAALFVAISGLLHLLAMPLGSIGGDALPLIVVGLLYLAFAVGLSQGKRWLAYLVFLLTLAGISLAIGHSFGTSPVPTWVWWAIVVVDLFAATALFVALWRSPQRNRG